MKILESRPGRYDSGINILTGGHANRIKDKIVKDYVEQNSKILDIGCGTGELAIKAAKLGANVSGIDISKGMLAIAEKKVEKNNYKDKIKLFNGSVIEIDNLFKKDKYNLITSTLVFSELYTEERKWALKEIKTLLTKDGKFVLACEVRPNNIIKRFLHFLLRLPLAIITYIIAQTGTKAVKNLDDEILAAGFIIEKKELSLLGSFAFYELKKSKDADTNSTNKLKHNRPNRDFCILKTIWDFIGRWFPNPVEPGLRIIGNPDENSPVFVTANFHLTVRRVEKSLKNLDCYLLVAPTNGINVWCASCGTEMNTHSIITAIKTSNISNKVNHRKLILPQLSAPGIDLKLLENATNWSGVFGPVYSKDIPEYIDNKEKKTKNQRSVRFPLIFRLEMLLSMSCIIWALMSIIVFPINHRWFLYTSAILWGSGFLLYACYPIIPFKSGWLKTLFLSIVEITILTLITIFLFKRPWWVHWKWMLGFFGINSMLGIDLKGIVAGNESEAEWLFAKLRIKSFGKMFSLDNKKLGKVKQDRQKCISCGNCIDVCPKGVFIIDANKSVVNENQKECFGCNACVKQCPTRCLKIV